MKKLIRISSLVSVIAASLVLFSFSNKNAEEKKVNIKSFHDTYVTMDMEKGGQLFANRKDAKDWEVFTIVTLENGKIAIKASNSKYVSVDKEGKLFARALVPQEAEMFDMVPVNDSWVAFKAYNGKYVSADKDNKYQLAASRSNIQEWESFNVISVE
jgi:major membrane immunogen (membrane-anchored lipoprotein)